jgi:hypothetical protein
LSGGDLFHVSQQVLAFISSKDKDKDKNKDKDKMESIIY